MTTVAKATVTKIQFILKLREQVCPRLPYAIVQWSPKFSPFLKLKFT
jgi:hypothetical protein